MRGFSANAAGNASMSGSGRRATSVGCPVMSACAFTWKTKSSGVRAAHSDAMARSGSE
jgi:hypothetical protein